MRKKHMICGNVLTLAATLSLAMAAPRAAVGEIVITTANSYTFAPAANNLIAGMVPSTIVNGKPDGGGPVSKLTDGDATTGNANTYTVDHNAVLTYALSEDGSPHVVTCVNLYSGWSDQGRKDITVKSLAYSTPVAPEVFVEIPGTAVDYQPGTSVSAALAQYTSTDGIIATEVHSFRINFGLQQNNFVGYREIEIIGVKILVNPDCATDIKVYEATLAGTVSEELPEGTEVSVHWGTAPGPATWTDSYTWPSTPQVGGLSHTVSGLSHSTEYFFCFSTSNETGVIWSSAASFSTLSGTSEVEAGAASEIVATSAKVSGTLTYDGAPPTTVYAFWGEDAEDLDFSQSIGVVADGADFTSTLSGLAGNTVYFYSFLASNDVDMAWSVTNSFRTPGTPELTGMVVDRVLDTTAHVSATLADGGDTQIYFVCWETSAPSTLYTNDLGVLPLGVFHSVVYDLSPSTSYGCQLVAVNANGTFVLPGTPFTTTATIASFTSVQSGAWSDPATWGEPDAPRTGLDVTISSGHIVVVDMASEVVRDVQVSGTLSSDGWGSLLRARNVTVAGTVTHELNTATEPNALGVWEPTARVNIECANLSVLANGKIDVNAKGYVGGKTAAVPAAGPGAGIGASGTSIADLGIGAGHGGNGGKSSAAVGGLANDIPESPSHPGSGGGHGQNNRDGGHGGGAVKIVATGSVSVAGNILANGANGIASNGVGGGGGAGGSIHIICETFSGSGTLSANGAEGASNSGGGGGGGCIAIDYDPVAQSGIARPTARIVALGGQSNSAPTNPVEYVGEVGTLWFSDNQFLTRVTASDIVQFGGRWVDQTFTEWNVDALTLDHGWLRFTAPGFRLNVAGDLTVLGSGVSASGNRSNSRIYRLELTDGVITCRGDMLLQRASVILYSDAPGTAIVCDGDLVLNDQSYLHVYSAVTNDVMPDFTSSVTVGGRMAIEGNSWVYPRTDAFDPASTLFTATDFFIDATSGIDASLQGYSTGTNFSLVGFGPGSSSAKYAGASHGGWGGTAVMDAGPYGSAEDPVTFGSGGSGGAVVFGVSRGGGVIRLVATGKVVLNGKLLAYGGVGGRYWGGSAGGSVNIVCDTFWGTNGVISAYGADAAIVHEECGGGGGGRIAVKYNPASQAGVPVPDVVMSVRGGGNSYFHKATARNGGNGTLYFPDSQLLVRSTTIRHNGFLVVPGFTRWDADELAFENCWFRLPDGLELNVAGTLTISGAGTTSTTTTSTGSEMLFCDQLEASNAVVRCGSLVMDSSALVVKPGETNIDGATYAGLVDVAGAMVVGPGAWVYPFAHPQNGGVVLLRAGSMNIGETGGIKADGLGYAGGIKANNAPGNGPGAGTGYSNSGGAGGYGGRGATHTAQASAFGGEPYGLDRLPLQPGSGGVGSTYGYGGAGGGVVWMQVKGGVVLDGSISANGGMAWVQNSGDGSGGGILIDCRTFSGSGTLAANGGINASSTTTGANGGGGRIAVWEKITDTVRARFMAGNFGTAIEIDQPVTFDGTATAACGGVGREGGKARAGTVVFLTCAPEGTIFMVR